jgi:hypothetical protein
VVHEVRPGLPLWYLLSTVSDLVGFILAVVLIVHIGRRRLVRRWHGAPPPAVPRPLPFWSAVGLVLLVGLVWLPVQPVRFFLVQAIQAMLIGGIALLAGAVMVHWRRGNADV